MGFAIVVDSTCDFTGDEYRSLDVTMVPLSILIDEVVYKDQVEISSEEFFERMDASENLPQSSQPTPLDFQKAYESLAEKGYDGILSVHIAGVLSGTIESARIAAQQVDIDVRTVDAAAAGATASMAIAVQKACEMRDAGASLDEAQAEVEKMCAHACFLVAPETLENLLKGGRLSADQVKTSSLLNIKPIFSFNEKGVLFAFGKAKGMRGVIKTFVEELQKQTQESGIQRVRFCYAGNEKVVEELKQALAEAEVSYIDCGTCPCGATITTHLGTGALGFGMIPNE